MEMISVSEMQIKLIVFGVRGAEVEILTRGSNGVHLKGRV